MIIKKTLSLRAIFRFAGQHLLWLVPWMLLVTTMYHYTHWNFLVMPWLPLSLIGTAVAFYVGFKNNQSYARLWEARIIWGALVNESRKLGTMIKNYRFEENIDEAKNNIIRKEIIYRHIAYLYQLREQLLKPTVWEHVRLNWIFGKFNQRRRIRLFNLFAVELNEITEQNYLSVNEKNTLEAFNNKATQLLDQQSLAVQLLYENKSINYMQQSDVQEILNNFYDHQGRAERIKNFPFPRQFASFGFMFVCIFVFLLPFGIVSEFAKMGDNMIWLSVPIGVVIGWIYVAMELIGDYSENPFEGLQNDIPMLSICRTIEIDLLQMTGEKKIPKPIEAKAGVLL